MMRMMRAIKRKSSLLRRLVGDDGGVGTNRGGGVIGGDGAGAKEPPPGMPLAGGAGVACPPARGVGYGGAGGRGVRCAVERVGGEAPELLPSESGGVLCPPLDDGANDEPDGAITGGGGGGVGTRGR